MRLFVIAALVFAAGCASAPAAPTGPVDATMVLAPGDVTDVPGSGIRLRFEGVLSDSRCPADVVCIQAGDAIVRIDVLPQRGAPVGYDLHTANMQPVRHDDLTIALEALQPYPVSTRTIEPGDYRATLRVTR